MLSLMIFLPLLGAIVIMMMPKTNERLIKNFSIFATLPSLLISILIWANYDDGGGYYEDDDDAGYDDEQDDEDEDDDDDAHHIDDK